LTVLRAFVLTLDVDGPDDYLRLHGADAAPMGGAVMLGRPLERFAELCGALGVPATVFLIGRDVGSDVAPRLRALARAGHELACHSYAHDYQLARRAAAVIGADLRRARAVLEDAVGERVVGYRAPGYQLCPDLLDALETEGFLYDSSIMPSPPYFLAKAAVVTAYRLLGRPTQAMLGSPLQALAPRRPFRPGPIPWRPGPRDLWELPIAVAGAAGLPVTGAALVLAPPPLRRALMRGLEATEVLVLNLHALDFADADELPPALARLQPELRLPWSDRERRLRAVLAGLRDGREALTGATVARRLERVARSASL
jgi:hypothetical protein